MILFRKRGILFLLLLLVLTSPLWSAYLTNMPVTVKQPDGTELQCYASGDEYFNWLHDKNNYTIIQSPTTGYYMYAVKNGNEVVAGTIIAGRENPASKGLVPNVKISNEEYQSRRQTMFQVPGTRNAPTTGTINNLVVFIRFSGESEFTQTLATYNGWFNSNTVSEKNYFLEASYNQLTVNTTFYPPAVGGYVVSYQDSHARGYYQPYNATTNTIGYSGGDDGTERATREFSLLESATNAVSAQIPSGLNIDADNDGNVDNVVYVVSGSAGAWASLLWPHRWAIYDRNVIINNKRVYDFNLQLVDFLTSQNVGVLCHEFFHTLGSPDLYHYTSNGITTVGSWDLMENNTNPPQHMGAYMKYKYGHWISSIPIKSAIQSYTLNPITSPTGNAYRINSPNSTTEFFVVEYRVKSGTFESSIPGSGLLIYRINTLAGNGNASGPPDEVYIYRPNGTSTANGTISSANYSSNVGRTAINATTNPTPFLSDSSAGGLVLSGIGSAGSTITFNIGNPVPGAPTCEITSPASGTIYNVGDLVSVQVNSTDPSKSVTQISFYLDGSGTPAYTDSSSPYSWDWSTAGVTPGMHTIRATATDNLNNSTSNDITIGLLSSANEGFETGNFTAFPWVQTGNAPWTVQTTDKYSGTRAAKSGTIADSQTSSMAVSVNILTAGSMYFAQKVSSESGWDYLKFYIDNVETGSWSGIGSWEIEFYPVTTGIHEFKWTYSKDTSTASGSDCAYVDHIGFPSYTLPTPPQITWSPTSMSQSLMTNQTATQNLVIGNTGVLTLNYIVYGQTTTSSIMNESFEGGSIPTGWSQEVVTGSSSWICTCGGYSSQPAAAYDGSYNVRLYYPSTSARVTKLITPSQNLSGAVSATLTFWHAQSVCGMAQDQMRVYYKTSSTGTWNLLATYTSNLTAWTQETIILPSLTSTYYIGFEGTAKNGYGVCLDQVQITTKYAASTNWLTLNGGSSTSGSIAYGQPNQTVNVGFNSAGLSEGTYTMNLTLTSNSNSNANISIPVTLNVAPLQAPANLHYVRNGANLELHWNTVTGASGYKVYEADTPNGSWTLKTISLTNQYILPMSGLLPHKFYKITATTTP
ncbi:MAG TPA: M6 family metalloprotease domain-containing protein [Candidatus Cloacimonadota bacterium]|nr:M6 family metalloprotease domain-containing protein [Candidatus Cloacimonadota bacterium]